MLGSRELTLLFRNHPTRPGIVLIGRRQHGKHGAKKAHAINISS
jgi:hypothetical protein